MVDRSRDQVLQGDYKSIHSQSLSSERQSFLNRLNFQLTENYDTRKCHVHSKKAIRCADVLPGIFNADLADPESSVAVHIHSVIGRKNGAVLCPDDFRHGYASHRADDGEWRATEEGDVTTNSYIDRCPAC